MTTANKRCPSLSLPFPGRPQNTRRLIAGELPLRRVSLEPRIPREPGESKEPGDPIAFPASRKSVLRNSSSSSSSWGFPWGGVSERGDIRHGDASINLDEGGKKGWRWLDRDRARFARFLFFFWNQANRGSDRRAGVGGPTSSRY